MLNHPRFLWSSGWGQMFVSLSVQQYKRQNYQQRCNYYTKLHYLMMDNSVNLVLAKLRNGVNKLMLRITLYSANDDNGTLPFSD